VTTVELDAKTTDALADLYRQLHSDPELSFEEHQTAARIVDALAGTGCEITQHVGGTGVVAVLRNCHGDAVAGHRVPRGRVE
jgi:hippurate hydrolase